MKKLLPYLKVYNLRIIQLDYVTKINQMYKSIESIYIYKRMSNKISNIIISKKNLLMKIK